MREVGIILIAAFAIDRIVTGIFFLLSFSPDLRSTLEPGPADDPEQKRLYRVIYTIFAAYLGTVVFAGFMRHRLSTLIGTPPKTAWGDLLDVLVTGLLLAGGADRLADALKLMTGGEVKPNQAPIEITGKVVLEQSGRADAAHAG
ncbi:MAG TPA: hypothetical protein VMH81_01900 [Bryobacteraceae bacterium]|nr:hypothetical protein [Bryobacteraceae bacterium]